MPDTGKAQLWLVRSNKFDRTADFELATFDSDCVGNYSASVPEYLPWFDSLSGSRNCF